MSETPVQASATMLNRPKPVHGPHKTFRPALQVKYGPLTKFNEDGSTTCDANSLEFSDFRSARISIYTQDGELCDPLHTSNILGGELEVPTHHELPTHDVFIFGNPETGVGGPIWKPAAVGHKWVLKIEIASFQDSEEVFAVTYTPSMKVVPGKNTVQVST